MGVIRRFRGDSHDWDGVAIHRYETGEASGATRRILVGPADGCPNFALRYFEVPPGGKSALDQHAHDHGVVILRGRARLRLGDTIAEVGFGDAIYIPPGEIHQFESIGEEPLGFLCVVAKRGPRTED